VKTGRKAAILKCLAVLIMMACLLSGCTTFDSFRRAYFEEKDEDQMPVITIGVLEPQTGRNSDKGLAELKGIELANSIYSNVDGYKIVLSKVDTQSKVSTARTAVQGLIAMKPVAIIGSAGEATSLAASEYIEEAGIPTITPSASNPLITQTNDYYFRACMTEPQMGEGLAEYAYKQLGSTEIALISLKNDSSTAALIDGFRDKIRKYTKKDKTSAIKSVQEITGDEESMDKALDKIRSVNSTVCFVSLGTESMDMFFTKAEEKNLTGVTYLGPRSWGNSDFVSMMKKHPDIKVVFPYMSVISGTAQSSDKQTEEAQRFQIEYESRYGADDMPTESAALGYDSYLILINAIHNAKSQEGPAIRQAMLDLRDLKGATGVFNFDERGNVVRTVNLSTISDDMVVSEYITKSEAEAKELENVEANQEAEVK
jgi:branched-chain amino acid transport system substrate-binding protein